MALLANQIAVFLKISQSEAEVKASIWKLALDSHISFNWLNWLKNAFSGVSPDPEDIQQPAVHIRSIAPRNLFNNDDDGAAVFDGAVEQEDRSGQVDQAGPSDMGSDLVTLTLPQPVIGDGVGPRESDDRQGSDKYYQIF